MDIRYNVVPVDGLFGDFWQYESDSSYFQLKVRYRDELHAGYSIKNAPEVTVLVKLKSMDLSTGAVTTLLTFNSNDFYAAPGFQTKTSPPAFSHLTSAKTPTGLRPSSRTDGSLCWATASSPPRRRRLWPRFRSNYSPSSSDSVEPFVWGCRRDKNETFNAKDYDVPTVKRSCVGNNHARLVPQAKVVKHRARAEMAGPG